MRTLLLVIDPQRSFCEVVDQTQQQTLHNGELCVPGAWEDMNRLANAIRNSGKKINSIVCTLDSHHPWHIAHGRWYNPVPAPFTVLSNVNGEIVGSDGNKYDTAIPSLKSWTLNYLSELSNRKRYPHVIWPEHCLIGTLGSTVVPQLFEAFHEWSQVNKNNVTYVTKGSNPKVEHFGAVFAEVEDPQDFTTKLNTDFVNLVMSYDRILLAGEALSHCLANTVRDLSTQFPNGDLIRKCVLLQDCASSVPGFETLGDSFISDMCKLGMKVIKSDEI